LIVKRLFFPYVYRHLDGVIGHLRFSGDTSDEDSSERLVELEALRDYLLVSCAAIDQAVVKMSSAKDRWVGGWCRVKV
jgi:hypothetical protein